MKHHIINHQEQFVDGDKHTNTIEGFGLCSSGLGMAHTTTIKRLIHPSTWQNGVMFTTTENLKLSFGSF